MPDLHDLLAAEFGPRYEDLRTALPSNPGGRNGLARSVQEMSPCAPVDDILDCRFADTKPRRQLLVSGTAPSAHIEGANLPNLSIFQLRPSRALAVRVVRAAMSVLVPFVLRLRHGLKVIGVDAPAIPAEVRDLHSGRNVASVGEHPRNPMRVSVLCRVPAKVEVPITGRCVAAGPKPTLPGREVASRSVAVNLAPEPRRHGIVISGDGRIVNVHGVNSLGPRPGGGETLARPRVCKWPNYTTVGA